MDTLKKTTKVTHYVDVFDLADYLSKKIGRSIEFIDTANDSSHSIKIEKSEIDDYDRKVIDDMISKGYISLYYGYHAALTYCANMEWLDEGDYVIEVSW